MALGYQRIHDLSPLSLKLLNDQMEQLWKKMMGGLESRDLTDPLRAQINSAVTQGQFTSLIEQNAQSIRLAVGSGGGENKIRNAVADFGTEMWEAKWPTLFTAQGGKQGEETYFLLEKGNIMTQKDIACRPGLPHTLAFDFHSSGGVRVHIGQERQVDWQYAPDGYKTYSLPFTPTEETLSLSIEARGDARITRILVCEGEGASFRRNPGELRNSSIALSDERVVIDTPRFDLRLRAADGTSITEMSADVQGFSSLYIAQDLFLRGKPFMLGEGRYDLWVHPDASPTGERRYFTGGNTQPPTMDGFFPDIQEALDFIPRWCNGEVYIHIKGGAAWQYPSSRVVISHFIGGGKIHLMPWQGERFFVKRVEVMNNSLPVSIDRADINACSIYDQFHVSGSVCSLHECKVNGRGVLTQAAGFFATHGALLLLGFCQAHNCGYGAQAVSGGRVLVEGGEGSGNVIGCQAATGGIVMQSGSTFAAGTPYHEISGGKILVSVSATKAGIPPEETPMEWSDIFDATRSASYDGQEWTTSPDWIQVDGTRKEGYLWFDTQAIRSKLSGRTAVYASLTLRRRSAGGRAGAVPVRLLTVANEGPAGRPERTEAYGVIGRWAWGERRTVRLPLPAVEALFKRNSRGFLLLADEEIAFEGVNDGYARLEIVYR